METSIKQNVATIATQLPVDAQSLDAKVFKDMIKSMADADPVTAAFIQECQAPVSGQKMMADSKFFMGYSRWVEAKAGYETWDESVDRVMAMHEQKYADKLTPELLGYMGEARAAYKEKLVLGAQRALQFGGEQLLKHEARMYNCSSSHADRPAFFQEAMYLLLCGCGVGFSVQKRHVSKLPKIAAPNSSDVKAFQVPDDIEGWAQAFGVLLSSYFVKGQPFPEYAGKQVHFNFSKVRPKGSFISGGFKAPGPEGLRKALIKCEELLQATLAEGFDAMRSIVVYDFVMHMADAVLSGGVRRSATLCMFDKFDQEMMFAKIGNWQIKNPQRGRSNNSVVLKRDELTREEWAEIMKSVRDFGEPGFIFVDDYDFCFNPCVEIGMKPIAQDGESGFQFCNLTEINGAMCVSKEVFLRACVAGAVFGTLQAGYTNFKFVSDATRRITEHEALIGVSITGWMNNPHILFDKETMIEGARMVKKINRIVAKLLGINPAARSTCGKPAGNASVLLGTASGVHGEHSPMYMRNVQMNADDEVAKLVAKFNPAMVEKSVWSANGTDVVVSFPVVSKPTSIYKSELLGTKQLEFVKLAQQYWVEYGTDTELCVDSRLRHNISNTISVDNWDTVEQYIFDNRENFAGISLLAAAGDKAYAQAPFTEVLTYEEIGAQYGSPALFASGLIVDGLHAFDNDLWNACATAMGFGEELSLTGAQDLLKRDWVRRFVKFSSHYAGDLQKTSFLLKDCYNFHKWDGIMRSIVAIDFSSVLAEKDYIDVTTLGAQSCAGNACAIEF